MKKHSLRWLLFLIPLVILAPVINRFVYPRYSNFSDITVTFYPNVIQFHDALILHGTLPLWSDAIMAGYPFAADPNSCVWYLPCWLTNLAPFAASFNLVIIFHLILAGIGMTLFLKREGLSDFSALVGGLVFELTPKIWAHFGAGHFTILMAISWTPWLLLAQKEFILSGYSWKRLLFPGIVFGLIILSNSVWAPYAVLIWVAYALVAGFQNRKIQSTVVHTRWLIKILGGGIIQVLLGLLISAPLWLLLNEFTQMSSRVLMTVSDRLIYSLPPADLLNLLIPNIGGMQEWVVYLGIFPLFLILLALWKNKKQPLTVFWGIIAGISLLISLGANLPLVSNIYRLPLFNLLRVPTKFYFLTCLAAAVLCAFGFESLVSQAELPTKGFNRFWTAVAFFAILISVGISLFTHSLNLQYVWAAVAFALSLLFLSLWGKRLLSPAHLGVIAIVLIFIDLLGINLMGLKFLPESQALSERAEVATFLKAQPGDFRVYSPSYSLPQQTAAKYGVRLVSAVNPLMLLSYVDFMESASGIPVTHYSVSMPDFPSDSTAIDNSGYIPNAPLLGLMNVRFVLSEFDLSASGLTLVKTIGNTRVYENQKWLPLAWVQSENTLLGEGISSTPEVVVSPNEFKIEATGYGELVLSEMYYPGWKMYVDGNEQPIKIVDGLFMGADLKGGNSSLDFIFQPSLILIAIILAATAWTGIVVIMVFVRKNGQK